MRILDFVGYCPLCGRASSLGRTFRPDAKGRRSAARRISLHYRRIDSAQALLLAMQMIGSEIYTSSYHRSGNLFLDAPGRGYGFPVAATLRDLLEGDDRKDAGVA